MLRTNKNLSRILFLSTILLLSCSSKTGSPLVFGKDSTAFSQKKWLHHNLGFLLYEPSSRKVIFSHNRHKGFIPASVTKVATTAAALDILGEDFRFKTELAHDGYIHNGTLHGNIYIKGYGDPFLHIRDLMRMREFLSKTGITNIKGKYIYDDSLLCRATHLDRSMDDDAAYNPGVSALSGCYNSFKTHYSRIRWTKRTRVFATPQLPIYSVRSKGKIPWLTTRFSRDRKFRWHLRAASRPSGRKRLPVRRPSLYTAHIFARLCSISGIQLPAPERGRMPDSANTIHCHRSRPLYQLTDITLAYSDNLMAELLMLQSLLQLGHRPKTLRQAGKYLAAYYRKQMPKIRWNNLKLANGSGLSPATRITPEQMVAFLHYGLNLPLKKRSFLTLLLPSGMSWSLGNRLHRPGTALRVWAKTGTIFYAVSLTGVVYTHSGRKLLFAVMYSDAKKQAAFRRFRKSKKREKALRKAIRWVQERKKRIDRLVAYWVKKL